MEANSTERTLERAAELVSRLKALIPSQVQAAALGDPSKLPFKLLSVREPLLFRIVDLSEASLLLCREDRPVGAAVLARAVMESAAALYVLAEMVSRVVDTNEVGTFDETVTRMLFGSRNEKTPAEAINVLSYIDKMDKEFVGLRRWYNNLSEIAHPNYAGVMALYAEVDRERYIVEIGPSERLKSLGSKVVVPALCSCLKICLHYRSKIEEILENFCRVCHAANAEA